MKRILTTLTLIGLSSQLHAATASDAIRQMETHVDSRHHRIHHATTRSARLHRVHHIPSVEARRHPVKRAARPATHPRKKIERQLASRTAIRRNFRTLDEYRSLQQHQGARNVRHVSRRAASTTHGHRRLSPPPGRHNRYLGNGWYADEHGQYDEQYTHASTHRWHKPRRHRGQHGYHHYRRQWYLTYLYERASFVDHHGYHYGYFNQRGFIFEGQFYHYDRAYTYQDRLHGKGLFAHRFYRPIRAYAYDTFEKNDGGRGGFFVRWTL